jgi:prepilin peptidase CpaA
MIFALLGLVVFCGLLLWAAGADVATMEIPNRISILLAALYPLFALLAGMGWASIGIHLATGAGVLLAGYILFNLGVFGGGDAKVIAGAAVWTGPSALMMPFLFTMALAGALLTISIVGARSALRPADSRPSFVNRLLQPKEGVPYAVAIAAGGWASLLHLPIWRAFAG